MCGITSRSFLSFVQGKQVNEAKKVRRHFLNFNDQELNQIIEQNGGSQHICQKVRILRLGVGGR